MQLTESDRSILSGEQGEALQFAMDVVVRAANLMEAESLIDVSFVHVDACHYYGHAHIDFAQYFVDHDIKFKLPAWTNTVPVSLLESQEVRDETESNALAEARQLAELYRQLGCNPVWTCAPYQLPGGPVFGDHIIGSESNAVAYFNAVVGARTNKYGDFLDVCAGLIGRAPYAGLHTDEGRRGQIGFDVSQLPEHLLNTEVFCHVLGHLMGQLSQNKIPVVIGMPKEIPNDSLKAISAAGAASGGITMFHIVGVTPEAKTIGQACQDRRLDEIQMVTPEMITNARDSLSSSRDGLIEMVALGTPHFSFTEFENLVGLIDGKQIASGVVMYVSTSRFVSALVKEKGWMSILQDAGVKVLVDTCTYFSPTVRGCRGRVMTNSAKWAYYAPGMLSVEVIFGSLEDCVASAICGEVKRDPFAWGEQMWGKS